MNPLPPNPSQRSRIDRADGRLSAEAQGHRRANRYRRITDLLDHRKIEIERSGRVIAGGASAVLPDRLEATPPPSGSDYHLYFTGDTSPTASSMDGTLFTVESRLDCPTALGVMGLSMSVCTIGNNIQVDNVVEGSALSGDRRRSLRANGLGRDVGRRGRFPPKPKRATGF